jgi:hypothetical protein
MSAPSVYAGARNGDRTNSEAQFQGRVVENAFIDQFEIQIRKDNMKNDAVIHPYDAKRFHADPAVCTLKTNEICLKRRIHTGGEVSDAEKELYAPGLSDHLSDTHNNQYPRLTSAFNGYYISDKDSYDDLFAADKLQDESFEELRRAVIRKDWQLAGIVGTNNDQLGFHGEIGRPDLPVQLGGVYTISNFGHKPIFQGDLVVWNVPYTNKPKQHCDETPEEKLVVVPERYDPTQVCCIQTIQAILNPLMEAAGRGAAAVINSKEFKQLRLAKTRGKGLATIHLVVAELLELLGVPFNNEAGAADQIVALLPDFASYERKITMLLVALADNRAEYNSRIVGRATTTALPGQNFNIYMGNYCI